jgi:hypothetical protein
MYRGRGDLVRAGEQAAAVEAHAGGVGIDVHRRQPAWSECSSRCARWTR